MIGWKCAILLFGLAIAASACSSSRTHMLTQPPFEGRSYGLYPGPGAQESQRYRIGVGDVLKLRVRNHPEFEGEVKVDSTGHVVLPLSLDEVHVAGLTRREAGEIVEEKLRKYVLAEPRVNVVLERARSRFVYVLGAVGRPGKYAMEDERLYVREAIERAGWPLKVAALNRARLVSSEPERAAERQIRLSDVMYHGDLTQNYELQPGDIIYVPYSYVSQFVWHATEVLRPFGVLLNYDATAAGLVAPRTSEASDDDEGNND